MPLKKLLALITIHKSCILFVKRIFRLANYKNNKEEKAKCFLQIISGDKKTFESLINKDFIRIYLHFISRKKSLSRIAKIKTNILMLFCLKIIHQ